MRQRSDLLMAFYRDGIAAWSRAAVEPLDRYWTISTEAGMKESGAPQAVFERSSIAESKKVPSGDRYGALLHRSPRQRLERSRLASLFGEERLRPDLATQNDAHSAPPAAAHVYEGEQPAARNTASTVLQRMTKYEDIKENGKGFIWERHKTQPDRNDKKTLKPFKSEGTGAVIGDRGGTWKTDIEWSATNDYGDGQKMEAKLLGPDHRMGEEPASGGIWRTRANQLGKKYVAGHLLNHQLGGPGNDSRNLAPIPEDANKEFERSVEHHVKKLVNVQHRWVQFVVSVGYGPTVIKGEKTVYPSKIEAQWSQLDEKCRPIGSTRVNVVLAIKARREVGEKRYRVSGNGARPSPEKMALKRW